MHLVFLIDPVPASRPRVTRWATYYPKTYTEFKQKMQVLLRAVPQTLFDMPLFIEMTFFKMIPVSHSQKKREQLHGTYCVSNIDLDNLEKAIYDSLSGHIYVDDKQIVEHRTRKVWTKENPRIELEISSFKEFESPVCLKYPQ